MIAWIRYDESQVPTFSFPWYKGSHPAKNQYAEYPGRYEYKYPMAGTTNSTVSVHTFDIKARVTRTMKLPLEEDGYIPRIHFTSDPQKLAVFTLNKHQDCLEVYMANPRSTVCKLAVRESSDKYIKATPTCPAGGTYELGDDTTDPSCSLGKVDAEDKSSWHMLVKE